MLLARYFGLFNSVLGHVNRQVVDNSGFGALYGNVAQIVLPVYDDGQPRDVVYPVVVFVVLEGDLLFRAEYGERHHEYVVRYHDAHALPLGQVFEDDALHAIAKKALEKDTGARALRSIIEDFMLDIMYEIPKDPDIGEVVITKEYVEHTGGPRILMRSETVPQLSRD